MTSNSVDDADSLASNSGRINLSGFCIGDHYKPSDVARNTLPGSGTDTGRIPSVAAHNTLAGSATDTGSEPSVAACNTLPGSGTDTGRIPSVAARNTLPGSGNDTGRIPSVAVRSTQPQPYSPEMCGPENDQPNGESRLLLYIGASTNPLPLDYGFIAAPTTAKLQHGHVNPLPKESLHHG